MGQLRALVREYLCHRCHNADRRWFSASDSGCVTVVMT